jgi:hypothetical protein
LSISAVVWIWGTGWPAALEGDAEIADEEPALAEAEAEAEAARDAAALEADAAEDAPESGV